MEGDKVGTRMCGWGDKRVILGFYDIGIKTIVIIANIALVVIKKKLLGNP